MQGNGHLRWVSSAGAVVVTSGSPSSDTRAAKNARADLRRAGLDV